MVRLVRLLSAPETEEVNAGIEGFAGPPVTAAMTHELRRVRVASRVRLLWSVGGTQSSDARRRQSAFFGSLGMYAR